MQHSKQIKDFGLVFTNLITRTDMGYEQTSIGNQESAYLVSHPICLAYPSLCFVLMIAMSKLMPFELRETGSN